MRVTGKVDPVQPGAVSRIGARLRHEWHDEDWDGIGVAEGIQLLGGALDLAGTAGALDFDEPAPPLVVSGKEVGAWARHGFRALQLDYGFVE